MFVVYTCVSPSRMSLWKAGAITELVLHPSEPLHGAWHTTDLKETQ